MNHAKQRNEWFYRGRVVRGLPSAELRRRAVRVFNPLHDPRDTRQFSRGCGDEYCHPGSQRSQAGAPQAKFPLREHSGFFCW